MRYYMCAEYGEQFSRPHFHYLIFGYDFPDKKLWRTHNGHNYYTSDELEGIWNYGHSSIGHVTVESAGYCSGYVRKKVTGDRKDDHYIHPITGAKLLPEFSRMSLKPAIGERWFAKYGAQDVYASGDFVMINGKKYSTPRYYDKLLERLDVESLHSYKAKRVRRAAAFASNNTHERLGVREEVQRRKLKKLHRGYENGNTE